MDAARREKKEHGTLAFPFQIYPALDGSEADDSDFIPYHWHPELEIITVDAATFRSPSPTTPTRHPRRCVLRRR